MEALKVAGKFLASCYGVDAEKEKTLSGSTSRAKCQAKPFRKVKLGILRKLFVRRAVDSEPNVPLQTVQNKSKTIKLFSQLQQERYLNEMRAAVNQLSSQLESLTVEGLMKNYDEHLRSGAIRKVFDVLSALDVLGKKEQVRELENLELFPAFCLRASGQTALIRKNQGAAEGLLGALHTFAGALKAEVVFDDGFFDDLKAKLLRDKPGVGTLLSKVDIEVKTPAPLNADIRVRMAELQSEYGDFSVFFSQIETLSFGRGEQSEIAQRLLDTLPLGQQLSLGELFGHQKAKSPFVTNETLRSVEMYCRETAKALDALGKTEDSHQG
ncbi:hypothetical protein [Pseudomonas sp. MWU13-3659]|uniref:hypothetical protein n=1 Tax=Pseudomonas sp. MWU13-3659 TaxID=2986964 RepID=UPI0020765D86|nr:hypothetical protein [Pseudomonas sp. MWU13-3659]